MQNWCMRSIGGALWSSNGIEITTPPFSTATKSSTGSYNRQHSNETNPADEASMIRGKDYQTDLQTAQGHTVSPNTGLQS